MNKTECKKYLRKAFNNIKKQNKSITIENLEREMNKIIEIDSNIFCVSCNTVVNYISYCSIKSIS